MHLSIGQAASLLGVSVSTLRRWEAEGFFLPSYRTAGNHRRYQLEKVESLFGPSVPTQSKCAFAYARVSSYDQSSDLETQKQKLASYCQNNFERYELISDLGSGLNYKKPGLKKLLQGIFRREISHLVINHKDRLLRFGSEIIFTLCQHYGVQVIILEKAEPLSFEHELATDVIELMTVFSSKLYGRRSHQNRKKLAA
jgi:excisionase family DNA binding protein